ncbi:MAG: PSD1 domain-containing protein [Acidobacteria bacterium]|nr:PSD1 domain-containing protein [Acidobacteriota bacterium]
MLTRWMALFLAAAACALGAGATPAQIEFFEKKIRPVLAEQCYACHSAQTMALGELRVDSREAIRKGGTRGSAVTPGSPEASVLLKAISYADLDLKMPPTGKLSEQQIADFRLWIEMGAPDPREDKAAQSQGAPSGYDFDKEREFWSFRPVEKPALPKVSKADWVATPVDAFLLARLEQEGMAPASEADKRTLIRRVTFDLVGLPPTPQEIEAFVADESPDAWQKLVERLLASPHYGERWARHWLDLVRFGETNGHEFDNDKLDAWRYRDYVVRAFNEDTPYNRFVAEQIAGDLLPDPRMTADGTRLDSPIGAGFYWLWEVLNSPTDSEKARADQVDNQIDVLGKTFFGMALGCARCHDHKFDPLPTADYYALAGVMHSTNLHEQCIDAPRVAERLRAMRAEAEANERARALPGVSGADLLSEAFADYRAYAAAEPSHPLYPLAKLAEKSDEPFAKRLAAMRAEMREWAAKASPDNPLWAERGDEVWEDFSKGYGKWDVEGAAFGDAPAEGVAQSDPGEQDEFVGILTTKKFVIPAPHVHVRMGGTTGERGNSTATRRFTLWADDHPSQNESPESERLVWVSIPLVKEKGRVGYLQITDRSRQGHIAVDRIVFSQSKEPPPIAGPVDRSVLALLDDSNVDSLEALAEAYARLAAQSGDRALVAALVEPKLAAPEKLSEEVPPSAFAMSSMDHEPHDVRIHQRGNHKNLGEVAPRQFLTIVAGEDQKPFRKGSGRLELAEWAASEENPLTARVMANRVWQHHFGAGIVRSPDNFGHTGDRPTHPELLDWLASRFVESGWSVKDLHRQILYSNAYRMQSRGTDAKAEADPENKLLSHMPVRRLEAEAIRDSLLAVAGTLSLEVGGESVPPHISAYQDGRGKPQSGPLDGNGRRSLYIQARRNFLTPLFLAFDYPQPFATIGRRGVSAVPSQALMLLNNELVHHQATRWAQREMEVYRTAGERLNDMFVRAFGRAPLPEERRDIQAFLAEQAKLYEGASSEDERVWADLAHVLFNSTEFLFVR